MLPCPGPHSAQYHSCTAQDWGTTFHSGAQVEKLQGAAAGRVQRHYGASLPFLGIIHHFSFSWLRQFSRLWKCPISHAVVQKGERMWLQKERPGGLALGVLSWGKAHGQIMKHRQNITTAFCSSDLGQSRGNKVWRVISQKPLNREWNPILHQICLSSQGEDQIICKDIVGKK